MITTDELRQKFLEFFKAKQHKIYPSDTLVPVDDPTLLFTSAGMNQFKAEFMGRPTEFRRKATCQRCLRTGDLDKVGKTNAHHTFFEMLGNFSFGDYFKDEAIAWAWEFLTEHLNLPEERLWVSVYQEDEEAYRIWQDKVGVTAEKIVKLGAEENFWPANAPEDGPDGPCGPCSEIFFDRGKDVGCGKHQCSPACDCGRFVEVWNLVFTQFNRQKKNNLMPLPNKNIDTGMGLERMAAVLQGKSNNFEIDIFQPIVKQVADSAGRSSNIRTCYTVADHIRAVAFAIYDGVYPSNDQRGYVIRKLIRRAVEHGRDLLDISKPFLNKIVPTVCRVMKPAYPELERKREEIAQVVKAEEERFYQTLNQAQELAKDIIAQLTKQGKDELPGEQIFKLYDTYGLPLETLERIAEKHGFKLDQQGFERELELQRQGSREGAAFEASVFTEDLVSKYKLKATKFIGDQQFSAEAQVLAFFKDDLPQQKAQAGDSVKIVLDKTPFYGESGGQVGDTGIMQNKKVAIEILDTHKLAQTIIHSGKIKTGTLKLKDKLSAEIDGARRRQIARNHTATHLLQAALRKVLGEHIRQAGSWVGPDRLRFDFTHFQAVEPRQLQRVEELVNQQIKQARKVEAEEMDFQQAKNLGALAFFGEKYQERVRAVKIEDVSLELCGGTHVSALDDIESFKIINESSVASGIRRIEAVTKERVHELFAQEQDQLDQLRQIVGGERSELPERIEKLLLKTKELEQKLDQSRMTNFKSGIDEMVKAAKPVGNLKVIVQEIKSAEMKLLRLMADLLRQRLPEALVVLGALWQGRPQLVCALGAQVRGQGLDAVKIIRAIAGEIEGSGGGREDFAQAGGGKAQGLKKALSKTEQIIREEVKP